MKLSVSCICSGLLCCCLLSVFSACGSSPSSANSGASAGDAMASAQAALDRMDGRAPAQSGGGSSASSAPAARQEVTVNTSRTKPAWVDSVDSAYNRSQYVAAVGYASNRTMAERNALANLVAFFGQSIQADMTTTNTYREAVKNGVTTGWTDDMSMENTIQTSASMDTLVGAEIREVWYDSNSTYYAAAVMEKTRTAQLYSDMIRANLNMIGNLVTMNQAEKNSLEGFSRYQFAAAVADINISYGNLLKLIGAAPPDGIKPGDDYRLEAQGIARAIPIGVTVRNDKSGRIQGAFAKALSELGFRSGGTNSRYVLDVGIVTSPVEFPNNQNKFTRIEVNADLTDTSTRSVLVPYNFNNREGHTSQSEADNRAYAAAERKIGEEYRDMLSEYLSQLLPKR